MTSKEFGKILQDKLTSEYGVELNVASKQQIYRSLALICRQMMSENHKKFQSKAIGTGTKQVYYLCMEFLMGRSLKMSLFNLGLEDVAQKSGIHRTGPALQGTPAVCEQHRQRGGGPHTGWQESEGHAQGRGNPAFHGLRAGESKGRGQEASRDDGRGLRLRHE